MKIAFMTSGSIKSSLSYRPLSFAKELVKKGHEVYIFSPRFDKYSKYKDEGIVEIDGVKIVRPIQFKFLSFELSLISYIFSSLYLLFKINPDLVHAYKPNPVTIAGLFVKLIKKTPVIIDLDDLDSEVMKIENNPRLKIELVKLSEKLFLKYSNGVTVASTFLKKLYSRSYKNSIVIVSNGAEFNNNYKKISLQNEIVFIGNMNRINILEPLFYSIKELSDRKLKVSARIIGSGEYLNYFKTLVKKLKITKQVKFLGYIKQEKLKDYVNPGDIGYCFMPNDLTIKACSSMKVFQYMQYGAIPLVNNVGDFPIYVYKNKAGYIAKNSNKDSLTQTIQKSILKKSERKEKFDFIIKNAKNDYQWLVLSNKIEELYKNIV